MPPSRFPGGLSLRSAATVPFVELPVMEQPEAVSVKDQAATFNIGLGGIVPWVAGSPTLADPDFDGCSWGHSFTPDRAVYPDVPADYDGPASFWGDAWRFGAHEEDIRILLYVNIKRDYCPSGEVIP
jgi:hypothetical protein